VVENRSAAPGARAEHVFHLGDVAQPVLARVYERGIVRQRPTH